VPGIAGCGNRGKGSAVDPHAQAVAARFMAPRCRTHQIHPHPDVAIAWQEATEAVTSAAADEQGVVSPGRQHVEIVLQIGTVQLHRQGLTGTRPQDVVDGLTALELAFDKAGIGSGSKLNPLPLDRSLGQATPSLEADDQEASGSGDEWSAHRIHGAAEFGKKGLSPLEGNYEV